MSIDETNVPIKVSRTYLPIPARRCAQDSQKHTNNQMIYFSNMMLKNVDDYADSG